MLSPEIANKMIQLSFDLHDMQLGYLSQDEAAIRNGLLSMAETLVDIKEELTASSGCCGGGCSCSAPRSSNIHPGFSVFGTASIPAASNYPSSNGDWVNVVSSNISAVSYDTDNETLRVRFRDGSEYEYYDVPQSVYEEFIVAPSKGRYFHSNIKNVYSYFQNV